jgi:DNA polymerase IV (DinB-like DNA polymerase)
MLVRIVGHLDIDYFYAQVEELQNPGLRDKPIVVCVFSGRTESSGVVSTSNYVARKYGVKSGMPITKAKDILKEKDALFIPLNMEKYSTVSDKVMKIIEEEIGPIQVRSIDEAYFDLTEASEGQFSKSKEIASQIKRKILESTGLTTSIGIGPTKTIAKIASDLAKPGGLIVVDDVSAKDFIRDLPVEKLPGVGPKTKRFLYDLGITTIGKLANADLSLLYKRLGKKISIKLSRMANILDDEPVAPNVGSAQISRIITLRSDTKDEKEITKELDKIISDLQEKIKEYGYAFRNIAIIAITDDMKTHTRGRTYPYYISDLNSIEKDIANLFVEFRRSTDRQVRRIGLKLSELKEINKQESMEYYVKKESVF